MTASYLTILCLQTCAIAALRMGRDLGICDRTGKIVEQLIEENPAHYNMVAADQLLTNQSQNDYTSHFSRAEDCVDNWGFFEEEIQLPDVAKSSEVGNGECPFKLGSKYGLNMYKFMVTDGLQHDALHGTQILEVGSGRGKGAAYVAQTFGPAKYVGVDLNEARVATASKLWGRTPNLEFEVGSASQLPIQNSSMDFVLNVESSFHYPDFREFLSEVHRVLRPGGKFLWTAPIINQGDTVDNKEKQFTASNFRLVKKTDITQNVMEARRNSLSKSDEEEFEALCAAGLHDSSYLLGFWSWCALPGSPIYKALEARTMRYVRFIAEKPR